MLSSLGEVLGEIHGNPSNTVANSFGVIDAESKVHKPSVECFAARCEGTNPLFESIEARQFFAHWEDITLDRQM